MSRLQRLWHHISHLPLLGRRESVAEAPMPPEDPTAEQIEAEEQERAERFKRDQLLPIVGMMGQPPA